MAAALVGISIRVTLKQPPNTEVHGRVANVNEQTSTLILTDVFFPGSGHRLGEYTVPGTSIADIKVNAPGSSAPQPPAQSRTNSIVAPPYNQPQHSYASPQHAFPQYGQGPAVAQHQQRGQAQVSTPVKAPFVDPAIKVQGPPSAPPKQPFIDPAILSVGKPPSTVGALRQRGRGATPPAPQEAPSTPVKPMQSATAAIFPTNTSPFVGVPKAPAADMKPLKRRTNTSATLTTPFSGMGPNEQPIEAADDSDGNTIRGDVVRRASITKTRTGKPMDTPVKSTPNKQGRKGAKGRNRDVRAENGGDVDTTPEVTRRSRGKGWRNTPLLQDPTGPSPQTPGMISGKVGQEAVSSSKRKNRRQKELERAAKSGWATEDATDIQELPDFDFEENLSKFDKRGVFDQLKIEDTTADEDRLVSFNKARPGTAGGKNLHPSENVLDGKARFRSSEHSSSDDFSDLESFSGRNSGRNSRRAGSRVSIKRNSQRSGSGVQDTDGSHPSQTAPVSLLTRSTTRNIGRATYASHTSGSPRIGTTRSPPMSPYTNAADVGRSTPRLIITGTNRTCHTITPGGMAAVEEAAELEFGLSEDIMAENSGRGIAEVTLSAINPGGRRLARENIALNSRPVVVALAGNHRTGARAVAAARHLQGRGVRVMVCLLGYARPADWDKDVRRQVDLFHKMKGWVREWEDVEQRLKRLEAPPELIIDALLGRNREFEALAEEDRKTVLHIVGWANKSRASVLSVEGPSGVGASTGDISILEGEPLEVRAKYVVCLGAPRTGILKALQSRHQSGSTDGKDADWLLWVVDIGVNRAWKETVGAAKGVGVPFGSEWVVQVTFSDGEEESRGR